MEYDFDNFTPFCIFFSPLILKQHSKPINRYLKFKKIKSNNLEKHVFTYHSDAAICKFIESFTNSCMTGRRQNDFVAIFRCSRLEWSNKVYKILGQRISSHTVVESLPVNSSWNGLPIVNFTSRFHAPPPISVVNT